MKIGRIEREGSPVWVGSSDGLVFYELANAPLEGNFSLNLDRPVTPTQWLAPIQPTQIFAIGLNYGLHALEFNNPIPEYPVVFFKSTTAITGHRSPIYIPLQAEATFLDYEVELAVVIGKKTKNVSPESALENVLGYTIANDVTSRDWQKGSKGGGQWCRAKSFDSFCPLGPWIVTGDEITEPGSLALKSYVNGELRQDSTTADMIFPVSQLISFLSQSLTLLPGTVILTGTPSGVGAGMEPKQRLKAGDEVRLVIEGIGELINPVEEESGGVMASCTESVN